MKLEWDKIMEGLLGGLNSNEDETCLNAVFEYNRIMHNDNGERIVNGQDLEWSVGPLISSLESYKSTKVRQEIVEALAMTVDESWHENDFVDPRIMDSVMPLLYINDDEDPQSSGYLRRLVCEILESICDPSSIDDLKNVLRSDKDSWVRASAAQAIHSIWEENEEEVDISDLIGVYIEILTDKNQFDLLKNKVWNTLMWSEYEEMPEVANAMEAYQNEDSEPWGGASISFSVELSED